MVFMPTWPKPLGNKPIEFGLDRILQIMQKLNNPHLKIPPVIHFAGTNGKGSTIAFTRTILQKAGYKVHTYTSPHLLNFNERIVLAGENISDDLLEQLADECRIKLNDISATFFEGTTAIAFLAFSRVDADIVLLETGMGGRLDCTNIIDKPLATVITPISLDHMEFLGPTVEIIAGEKAGIIKDSVPCITSLQTESVHNVLNTKASKMNTKTLAFGYDWVIEKSDNNIIYKDDEAQLQLPLPSLLGDHQVINAGTAIKTIKTLKNFDINDQHIKDGVASTKWNARMQKLESGKLVKIVPDNWEIWLDGAHNNAAASILSCICEDWTDKKTYLICGFTRGRDAKEFLRFFEGKVDYVGGLLVETEISAQKADLIAGKAQELGIKAKDFDSIEQAIEFFKTLSREPARILFCGSLYLASDAMKANGG